jgi:hypothetical protein
MALKPFALILCQPATEHHVMNNNMSPPKKKLELKIRLQGKKVPFCFLFLFLGGRLNKHKKILDFFKPTLTYFKKNIFTKTDIHKKLFFK